MRVAACKMPPRQWRTLVIRKKIRNFVCKLSEEAERLPPFVMCMCMPPGEPGGVLQR